MSYTAEQMIDALQTFIEDERRDAILDAICADTTLRRHFGLAYIHLWKLQVEFRTPQELADACFNDPVIGREFLFWGGILMAQIAIARNRTTH